MLVGSSSSLWKEGPAESTSAADAAVGTGESVKEAATSLFYKHSSFQSSVKSKSSQVRSAAYQTLRTYVQHIPQVSASVHYMCVFYYDLLISFVLQAEGSSIFLAPMTPDFRTVLHV